MQVSYIHILRVTGQALCSMKDGSYLFGSHINSNGHVIENDVNTRNQTPPLGLTYRGADMPQ